MQSNFDDKTKLSLFARKRGTENIRKLNIRYREINIKQQAQITYFGCVLDDSVSGEHTPLKVINRINAKLKFFHRKSKF